MHIVLVDNTRTKVIVAAEKYSANSPNNQVKLLPITDYIGVPRVKSGINGFVWDGDSGSSRGQQGTLIGNVVSGGRVLSTAAPGKNYYNFHFFNNNTTNWQLTQGPYNFLPIYRLLLVHPLQLLKMELAQDKVTLTVGQQLVVIIIM